MKWRDKIRDEIAEDLESGKLDRLVYREAKSRGIKGDGDIQTVQWQLEKSGHLQRKGRMFLSTFKRAA